METPYYIVKYHFKNRPRIVAFTHDLEKAQELCSHPATSTVKKTKNAEKSWFYGFTKTPPCKVSKAGYPSAGDLLKELYSKP